MTPADAIVVAIPCLSACRHVPPRCRNERVSHVVVTAQVRIARARRPDLAVSAWLVSAGGRDRMAILTDGAAHYVPMAMRLGQPLRLEEFTRILADPSAASRLRLQGIGARPQCLTVSQLPTRQILDDGIPAARVHAQAMADGWLVVDGIVHQRITPPCRMVRFARDDHRGRFHVETQADHALPERSVYLRVPVTEDPGPYADALRRSGRQAASVKYHRIEPGEVAVGIGAEDLLADVRTCIPLLVAASRPIKRVAADIRRYADLGTMLRRRDCAPLTIAGGIVEAFRTLAQSPGDRSAVALYAERLDRLA